MSDQWDPTPLGPPPYGYGGPPPGYQPPGYQPPPPGYGYPPPPPGWQGAGYQPYGFYGDGPPGKIRPTGISILLFFCTLGIYTFVYNYSVHDEMRRHSGRGIGGGVALLLTFIANIAMPFITPAEVGSLYARRGQPPPVSGWIGLWSVGPLMIGYIAQFFLIFATFAAFSNSDVGHNGIAAGVIVYFVIWIGLILAGGLLWFTKTNNALNEYWSSIGVQAY